MNRSARFSRTMPSEAAKNPSTCLMRGRQAEAEQTVCQHDDAVCRMHSQVVCSLASGESP